MNESEEKSKYNKPNRLEQQSCLTEKEGSSCEGKKCSFLFGLKFLSFLLRSRI